VVPIVVATPFVWFLGGYLADKASNALARRNGGRREPEGHLLNLILPIIFGIVGCALFGYAGQNIKTTHWFVLVTGIFFIALGFLTANTVTSVYIVESYPQWAGYASFRLKRARFTNGILDQCLSTFQASVV
jgi:MFS family permease